MLMPYYCPSAGAGGRFSKISVSQTYKLSWPIGILLETTTENNSIIFSLKAVPPQLASQNIKGIVHSRLTFRTFSTFWKLLEFLSRKETRTDTEVTNSNAKTFQHVSILFLCCHPIVPKTWQADFTEMATLTKIITVASSIVASWPDLRPCNHDTEAQWALSFEILQYLLISYELSCASPSPLTEVVSGSM